MSRLSISSCLPEGVSPECCNNYQFHLSITNRVLLSLIYYFSPSLSLQQSGIESGSMELIEYLWNLLFLFLVDLAFLVAVLTLWLILGFNAIIFIFLNYS